jgi:acetyl-CoA/propionyl-CoA carboxylase biotin carboxyl carrier protein
MDTGLIDRMPAFVAAEPSDLVLSVAAWALRDARFAGSSGTGRAHASELWLTPTSPVEREFLTSGDEIVTGVPGEPTASVSVARDQDGSIWVHAHGETSRLRPLARREASRLRLARRERVVGVADPELRAPMPGSVVAVHVVDGARVAAGDRIATIEAMKMEHSVVAPHDGIVTLSAAVGDQVARDHVLAVVTADAPGTTPGPTPAAQQTPQGSTEKGDNSWTATT